MLKVFGACVHVCGWCFDDDRGMLSPAKMVASRRIRCFRKFRCSGEAPVRGFEKKIPPRMSQKVPLKVSLETVTTRNSMNRSRRKFRLRPPQHLFRVRQPAAPLSAGSCTVYLGQDGEAEDSPARSRRPGAPHPPLLSMDAAFGSF